MGTERAWEKYTSKNVQKKTEKPQREWEKYTSANGGGITERVADWAAQHDQYVANSQKRYADRKFDYTDNYVSDSQEWFEKTNKDRLALQAEADSIMEYMKANQKSFDPRWAAQVQQMLRNGLNQQKSLADTAYQDYDWWRSFGDQNQYGQYGSAEEAYKAAQRLDSYQKKYGGQSYSQLQKTLSAIEDGEERQWLELYAPTTATKADYESEIAANKRELMQLNTALHKAENIQNSIGMGGDESDEALIEQFDSIVAPYGGMDALKARIESVNRSNWERENRLKYEFLNENEDYDINSKVKAKEPTAGFGVGFGSAWLGNGDPVYDYINELGKTHEQWQKDWEESDQGGRTYEKYSYMNEDEVKNYNYLYNTQGREAANEYLDQLEISLNDRKLGKARESAAQLAKENPFLANALSVPANLASGLGAIDVAGQVARKNIKEAVTGEYAGPVDYNRAAMTPGVISSTIRETTAQNITDSTGTIQLDPNEHPFLSRVLNGKGWADVYQLGMSMVDSAAVAAMAPIVGPAGTYLLGGSAATQGILDAVENGATDEQALAMGLISGGFEVLFEKYELESLLGESKSVVGGIVKQMFSEGVGEGATTAANLLTDTLVMADKSQFQKIYGEYIAKGLSKENAKKQAFLDIAVQVGWDVVGGLASGGIMGGAVTPIQINSAKNQAALEQYGGQTEALVQKGLEMPVKSRANKLAQKYQKQTQGNEKQTGKPLSGAQIRNLLAANQDQIKPKDMKLIQEAAKKRLTELGQTGDLDNLAALATKYATGGTLTKAERSTLVRTNYGARVANELIPQNITADSWAADIGTEMVNADAYNMKKVRDTIQEIIDREINMQGPESYQALDERIGKDQIENAAQQVSGTGKAVIRDTGKEIDLSNPSIARFTEDGAILNVNGEEVSTEDIDFESVDQALAFTAVSKIEHITPADASALLSTVDMKKPIGEQLNGLDEAYTFGYYGYSENDLKAGNFTGSLTQVQMNDAYKLGQLAGKQKSEADTANIKKMVTGGTKTAGADNYFDFVQQTFREYADTDISEEEYQNVLLEKRSQWREKKNASKTKAPTAKITYNHGGGVVEDIGTAEKNLGKLNPQQRGGIEAIKILQQLGIGGDYELFASYISKTMKDKNGNPMEVFLDDNGEEVPAYAGLYTMADGKIRININAYSGTKGLTLNALSHELTHFIKQWSPDKYKALAEYLIKTYEGTYMTMHKRVVREQNRLKEIRKEDVSYDEAYDEVVANAFNRLLEDGKVMERIAEIRQMDKSLADKIIERIRDFIKRFTNAYRRNPSYFRDSEALMEMKEAVDQLQEMFAEALVEASDNFRAADKSGVAKNGKQFSGQQTDTNQIKKRNPILTNAEIIDIQGIGKKSIFQFNSSDIRKTEKLARIYWDEMQDKEKTPFFRAWFGEWRVADKTPVVIAKDLGASRGSIKRNVDTGWDINVSGKVFNETKNHTDSYNIAARPYLSYIDSIIENAVLLDTHSIDSSKPKSQNSLLMHSLYAVADIGKGPEVIKLYVEEINNPNDDKTTKRGYQLQNIEKYRPTGKSSQNSVSSISPAAGNIATVADLTSYVKYYDANYVPTAVSKVVNADGTPKVMYHGSPAQFTIFDKKKAKGSGMYGRGFYFTDAPSQAAVYGNKYSVYLNVKNPLEYGKATVTKDQVRKFLEAVADNEDYSIENYGSYDLDAILNTVIGQRKTADAFQVIQDVSATAIGDMVEAAELFNKVNKTTYDGIIVPTETVVFRPEQIKSATDNIGTFDGGNPDIRYSTQQTDISDRELLANAFENLAQNSEEYKMLQEYKEMASTLTRLDRELQDINQQIRDIRFSKGQRDNDKLARLEAKANRMLKDITRYDKQLVNMEKAAPLRGVIEMEKKKSRKKTLEHVEEILQNRKERAERAELRRKIRRSVRNLNKILTKGNKQRNVKEDMKGFATKALELADFLFTDHISDDDLIRKGITVRMDPSDAALVKETEQILSKLYDHADSLSDEEFTKLDEQRKRNEENLRDVLTDQRNEYLGTSVYQLFEDLVLEYAKMNDSDQPSVKATYDPDVERFLRSYIGQTEAGTDTERVTLLNNMRVKDMTLEELDLLYKAYSMVLHSIRNANKLHAEGMKATVEETTSAIMDDISGKKRPAKGNEARIRNLANKIGWDYEKLYYALDRIGSDTFTQLILNIADGENIVMRDVIEAKAFLDSTVQKHGYNDWAVNKKLDRTFLDNTGKEFELTLGEIMYLYAFSKRADSDIEKKRANRKKGLLYEENETEGTAWDHLEYGGFSFKEADLKDPNPADTYRLTREQCIAITDLLTAEQKAYVDDVQRYLSTTMGEKGNEVSLNLYGIRMYEEKYYIPILTAGIYKAKAQESQAKAQAGFSTMSNAGFTKSRDTKAKSPIVLQGFMEIAAGHINEMSRYHGMVPALEDYRKVTNYSEYFDKGTDSVSFRSAMINAFGKNAMDYFDNLYREANSGAIVDKMEQKQKKLLSLFRKGSVAYSLSVLVQQPASLMRAYALIDPKYFGLHGIGAIPSGIYKAATSKWNPAYKDAYKEMLQYAPGVTMAKEIGGFDAATGNSIYSYLLDTNKSFFQSMKTGNAKEVAGTFANLIDDNFVANLPNVADKIAWIEIWNACKRETIAKNHSLSPTSAEFMEKVGKRFTEVIQATQVYDSIFSKSPLMKSRRLSVQMAVSFMNEPNTVANMMESAIRAAVRGDGKKCAQTIGAVVWSTAVTTILKSVVYAMRDEDEDETWLEKYVNSVTGNIVNDFLPFNYIPFVRDIWSAVQGYDIERADMTVIADAIKAIRRVSTVGGKDTSEMTEEQLIKHEQEVTKATWKAIEAVLNVFGVPLKNIRRDVNAVLDTMGRIFNPKGDTTLMSIWDQVQNGVSDTIPFLSTEPKSQRLYDAIKENDTAYLERLKSGYKDESAYNSAVRKALREHDNRIQEAAQAKYSGDQKNYEKLFKQIRADHFDYDNIFAAIQSEVSDIKDGKETKKESSKYSSSDFVGAIVSGDPDKAEEMRDYIIEYKVRNGDTREEAEVSFRSGVVSSTKSEYVDGMFTRKKASDVLRNYSKMSPEEANAKIQYWDFQIEHPEYDDLSQNAVEKYLELAEPANLSLSEYADFLEQKSAFETIEENGEAVTTVQDQVIELLTDMQLTEEQRLALWLAAGYKESTYEKVKW